MDDTMLSRGQDQPVPNFRSLNLGSSNRDDRHLRNERQGYERARDGETRERGFGGGRQTGRDGQHSPQREGAKRGGDRLNSEFGGSSNRGCSFFDRGVAPAPLAIPASRRAEAKQETPEDVADRTEDRKIARTINFLPRGSFDDHVNGLKRTMNPYVTPSFCPETHSAAVESGGYPLHPNDEAHYDGEVRHLQKEQQRRYERDYREY